MMPLTRSARRLLLVGAALFLSISVFGCLRQAHPKGALRLALPESPVPYDQAWKSSLDATRLFYDRIAVLDKEAGYFQTAWNIHQVGVLIGAPVKRSRLIGRVASRTPFKIVLDIEQEAFSMELGRWVADPPDRTRLKEINDRLKARLRIF